MFGFHFTKSIQITLAIALLVCLTLPGTAQDVKTRMETYVPTRAITTGPDSHWFGYYDKLQFDKDNRYILGMKVNFNDRPPTKDDVIELGMVDTHAQDSWIKMGESRAWCWQQGCMLQWLPGSDKKVIYNDRHGDRYVSVIKDVSSGEMRVLPRPVYAVSPNGLYAVSTNFSRLNDTRSGYGYAGVPDQFADKIHPEEDGIYLLNLKNGNSKLIISLDQAANIDGNIQIDGGKHWFNHLLFNTDGSRFIFLHRWHRSWGSNSWHTRMFTADHSGENIHRVADHDLVSHFIWKNPNQILAWSREPESGDHFHLYTDLSDKVKVIGEGVLTRDGHCTYSPDGKWILTDTYPDKERMQNLMLYRPADGKLVKLGRFYLSRDFKGQTRCDLHPRWSRDGKYVCIDSLHSGKRQMYLLDVSEVVFSE